MDAAPELANGPSEYDFEQSPYVGKIAAALAAAQAEIKNPLADSDNPFFGSRYADLDAVIEAVRGPLAKQGIARHQAVFSRGPEVGIRTALIHSSGEWLAATVWCKPDKGGPQALGSVITYLRRYSLAAAVGVAQADDDAEGAEKRPPRSAPLPKPAPVERPKLDPKVQARIKILQGECGIEDKEWREKLTQYYKVKSSAELSPEAADDLISKLEARRKIGGTTAHGTSETAKSASQG